MQHEIVPVPLIESIAKLKCAPHPACACAHLNQLTAPQNTNCRHGGTYKALCNCLKHKLLHHDSKKYDGYRLTNMGYDFLAIHTLTKRGSVVSVGRQIGVGKESDLFEVRPQATPRPGHGQNGPDSSIIVWRSGTAVE